MKSREEVKEVSSADLRGFASSLTLGSSEQSATLRSRRRRGESADVPSNDQPDQTPVKENSPKLSAPNNTSPSTFQASFETSFDTAFSSSFTPATPTQQTASFQPPAPTQQRPTTPDQQRPTTPTQQTASFQATDSPSFQFPTTFSSSSFGGTSFTPAPPSINEVNQKTKELMMNCFTKLEKGQFVDALSDVDQSLKLFGITLFLTSLFF